MPVEDGALAAEMIERHLPAASVRAMSLTTSFNEMAMAERRVAPPSGSSARLRHFADIPAGIDIATIMDSGGHGVEIGGANDLVAIDITPASDGNSYKWRT